MPSDQLSPAPRPAYRLIPSQFPPIAIFDKVATAADLNEALDLSGWSNDRRIPERIKRLGEDNLVYGVPNSSIILASYLHVGNDGMRFNGNHLGAWYAAASLNTAVVEVAHHLRREVAAKKATSESRVYRAYQCLIGGMHVDIRGRQDTSPSLYDPTSYSGSQKYGESLRASGGNGILYDSLRHAGGANICVYRPRLITDVMQAQHLNIAVQKDSSQIDVTLLKAN